MRSTPARTIPQTDLGRNTRAVRGSRRVGGVEAIRAVFYTGQGFTMLTATYQPEAGRGDGITELQNRIVHSHDECYQLLWSGYTRGLAWIHSLLEKLWDLERRTVHESSDRWKETLRIR